MDIKDIQHLAVERIYLVPDASEGQLGYVWCDDPAPGEGMDASEAVEYVRKDVHNAAIAKLEQERDAYRTAEEHQIALRQKIERERDALAAHVERLRNACQMAFQTPLNEHYSKGVNVALFHAIESTAENNRKRRDLIKQAEALEEFAEGLPKFGHMGVEKALLIKSRALRRQAEAQQ